MEEVGVDRVHGRPIRLFQLANWAWVYPRLTPFVLFVAADASANDEIKIRRFAADAIESGCCYVCTWGEECELVHDLFDEASIAADQVTMSTWHADESLAAALHFSLVSAWPDGDVPDAAEAAIVLAVEVPWIADVRRLVADQDELARLLGGKEQ